MYVSSFLSYLLRILCVILLVAPFFLFPAHTEQLSHEILKQINVVGSKWQHNWDNIQTNIQNTQWLQQWFVLVQNPQVSFVLV